MKIALVGAGKVATGLAKYWVKNGHQLFFTFSRDAEKLKQTAESISSETRTGTTAEAADFADVLVLATPWGATKAACEALGDRPTQGKVVMTCVNPLKSDYSGLELGTTISAGEEVARWLPSARVVEALPPFAEVLHSGNVEVAGQKPTVFVAAEDATAKNIVAGLLAETGAEVLDAGSLIASRFIEPAMFLLVHLAYKQGLGGKVALKILR